MNATNCASPYTDVILSSNDYNKLNSGGKVSFKGNNLNMLNSIKLDNFEVIMYNLVFKFKPINNIFSVFFMNHIFNDYSNNIISYKNYSFDKTLYFSLFTISNLLVITHIYDETYGQVYVIKKII